MIDASKLAEELHNEQEQTTLHENDCKILESKLRELQVNCEHSEIYSHLLKPILLSLYYHTMKINDYCFTIELCTLRLIQNKRLEA